MAETTLATPIGRLTLRERDGAIVELGWGGPSRSDTTPLLGRARIQLEAYFAGHGHAFDLPLAPEGSDFMRRVWAEMSRIPYGETATYGALAANLASAPRAIGAACARNPIPLLIPCHRVVGVGGRLTGYSGGEGVATKRWLVAHETCRRPAPLQTVA